MELSRLDYSLPRELIAQHPPACRTDARLMVVARDSRRIEHRRIPDIADILRAGDLLVMNDVRVLPSRLFGRRTGTGGIVEVLLLEMQGAGSYTAMTGSGGRLKGGEVLMVAADERGIDAALFTIVLRDKRDDGAWHIDVRLPSGEPAPDALVREAAKMPLPPYIERERFADPYLAQDRERYQTTFAARGAAVAAPTAGLHFTPELLATLAGQGVERAFVTLDVGPGTFKPVKSARVEDHPMHEERFELPPLAASAVNDARRSHRRVVAVGTTVARVLESCAGGDGAVQPQRGATDLMILPGYEFRAIDALLTNFHLPKSTLLALVMAFAGEELVREAYRQAIAERYRFFSYGDAMLIL